MSKYIGLMDALWTLDGGFRVSVGHETGNSAMCLGYKTNIA